jgi:hypothetical protein
VTIAFTPPLPAPPHSHNAPSNLHANIKRKKRRIFHHRRTPAHIGHLVSGVNIKSAGPLSVIRSTGSPQSGTARGATATAGCHCVLLSIYALR